MERNIDTSSFYCQSFPRPIVRGKKLYVAKSLPFRSFREDSVKRCNLRDKWRFNGGGHWSRPIEISPYGVQIR